MSFQLVPRTKFLLIESAETESEPTRILICNSAEERRKATIRAIFGDEDLTADEQDQAEALMLELEERGIINFEGDPPLKWITGILV